jgi:integrase
VQRNITDRWLESKKAEPGLHWDKTLPGFGVRVSGATGRKVFLLSTRFPDHDTPTPRALGKYPEMTLEEAREKAEEWRKQIRRGINPTEAEKRAKEAEERKRANSFRAVAEDFITEKLGKKVTGETTTYAERKGREVETDIRREFLEAWNGRPITEITPLDVLAIVEAAKNRGAPYQARNLLGHAKRLFSWAIGKHCYGLEHSPCDRIKAKDILGKKTPRKRVLRDNEIRAVWQAAEPIGYPYGPLFQVLLLTGARKSEIACARWSEIDEERRVLIVPDDRHKSERGHVIWFSDAAWDIVKNLPRFKKGDHLFSTTYGVTPVNGFSKAKDDFDEATMTMLRMMDPKAKMEDWVIHDLRRTMRSRLTTLAISQSVAELMIGHAQPGLVETYSPQALIHDPDYADLFAKLQDGWKKWAGKLRDILQPPPKNVVHIEKARA